MSDASLRDRRQALLDRPDLTGVAFCRAYAAEADAWLSGLAEAAAGGDTRHLALLAVGGYGRGELCPCSDLDVVLVHDGRRAIEAMADAVWYPVWDQGVHLDHSVRRVKDVLSVAADDLRVALGLLDGRMIWGDPQVAEPLLAAAVDAWRTDGGARWLADLREQMAERHRSQGDVAFLLEPDLKESHGGLRDVNVLRALAVYAPELADYVDLPALQPAATVLTEVRVALHRNAGRALDRLLLQEQDQVAVDLTYDDADRLMAAVSAAGRRIAWVSDDAWRRRALWQPTRRTRAGWRRRATRPADPPFPLSPHPDGPVGEGIVVVGGEVTLTSDAPVSSDAALSLRLAAAAAELDLPIARASLHRLADLAPAPPDPWPEAARRDLVRVLAAGKPAISALESLDQEGLLVRLLPEWQAVRNKPQRNAYHRFTVDRHLLEAATNAASKVDMVDRPDLLLLGTLFHDIGKGYPGDHTDVGIAVVGALGPRLGLNDDDTATLVQMVRLHLLLPDVATRRDLADPVTIDTVARAAGDLSTLSLLAALTEADSLATGPAAWGSWKAGLVGELVERTALRLQGQAAGSADRVTEAQRSLMQRARDEQRPVVQIEPPAVVVAAPDRRGLLASVTGTLALHGLSVRSADAVSEDGAALEIFAVEVASDKWPDHLRLRGDLEAVLSGRLALGERLQAKAAAYAGTRRAHSAHPVVPEVFVDNDASATSTVLEVRTTDEIGLLHRVTQALFDCGLDVVSARVSTTGTVVVDAFYVRRALGPGSGGTPSSGKVTDPTELQRIEEVLLDAVR
jgi:[protein-PII] uridylyltransferase